MRKNFPKWINFPKKESLLFLLLIFKAKYSAFTEEELNKNRDILVHFQKYRNYTPKTELNKNIPAVFL